jgi:enoyl-CoA hydratase/carnithine racemase
VSLPEVPLLGVLPGTGGLTRLVDKRKVRRDRADVFSHDRRGHQGKRAVEWGLVDALAPLSQVRREGREERAEGAARRRPRQDPAPRALEARRRSSATNGALPLRRRSRSTPARTRRSRSAPDGRSRRPRRSAHGRRDGGRCARSASSTTRSATCASTSRDRLVSSCDEGDGDAVLAGRGSARVLAGRLARQRDRATRPRTLKRRST